MEKVQKSQEQGYGSSEIGQAFLFVSLTSSSPRTVCERNLEAFEQAFTPVTHLGHGSDDTGCFSDHFSKGASGSQGTLPPPDMPGYSTSFSFDLISREEVAQALTLYTKKASGMDDISAWMLKTTAPAISDSLHVCSFKFKLEAISDPL